MKKTHEKVEQLWLLWNKDKYQADTFSDSEVSSIIRILSTLVQDRLIYAWNTEVFGYHYISFVF